MAVEEGGVVEVRFSGAVEVAGEHCGQTFVREEVVREVLDVGRHIFLSIRLPKYGPGFASISPERNRRLLIPRMAA